MDVIRKLWIVLIIAAPFWGVGFWIQRLENSGPPLGYYVEARGWWAWLLGLRPGRGKRVNLGGALYQIWALMFLVVGLLAVWIWDIKALLPVILIFFFLGFPLIWLTGMLIARFWNRQR